MMNRCIALVVLAVLVLSSPILAQEEEDFSQAPPDWDKWEPA